MRLLRKCVDVLILLQEIKDKKVNIIQGNNLEFPNYSLIQMTEH